MDDVDDERFSRAILSAAPSARHVRGPSAAAADLGERRVEGAREETLLGPRETPGAVRVRGLDAAERGRLQQEAQLLASLEVAGIGAAPAVLELEDEGYVRETAPAPRRRGGRRAAEDGSPPTGERQALAQAREELDTLIGALHERGWVLGATHGGGLGTRPDGSVIVIDLHGLRREGSLLARQEDRHWADSVLCDQDRTLRRRVHVEGLWSQEAGRTGQDAAAAAEQDPAPERSLPVPRRSRPGDRTSPLAAVTEVLRRPRLRRVAVRSGAAVLLCGALIGLGLWWAPSSERASTAAGSTQEGPIVATARPAPRIDQPQVLVAQLAGERHSYVTGLSDVPVSAPESAALTEDRRIREAYVGLTVGAGGPVVHSAEVLRQPGPEGTALLRAVTSMEELRLEDSGGATSTVPATERTAIRLEIRWDGTQWLVVSVEPLDEQLAGP